MATYLIQDPHHEYASRFIQLIRARWGHRAVGFFTCSPKERFYRRAECLPAQEFAALYEMDPADPGAFAALLRERHPDLVAIVPYSEETLELTAALQGLLPASWNDGRTLARFRQKSALKEHLREVAPAVRINFSAPVGSAADIFALGPALPARIVLKPDAGFGSRGVGIFDAGDRPAIEQFMAGAGGRIILEEFLDGPLYAVDGLVGERGEVLVVSVFASGRQRLNGSQVVYANGALVHEDTALFQELAAYARAVMSASGLRRSPFHMEVIRDARGPCLVEVGARLVGHSHAFTVERVHGGRLDFFGQAAAGYFGEPMDLRLSFDRYNQVQAVKIYGASEIEGTAYEIGGAGEVERLPSFDRWIVRPAVGARLHRTVDLFTVPYSAVLVAPRGGASLLETGEAVHRMVRFRTEGSWLERLRVDGRRLAAKLRQRAGWLRERARRALLNR